MACYNHAPFVARAIGSVLEQLGVDFEFLVADDGSNDGTCEVVESIHDPRMRFFPNEMNRGAAIPTNELIASARGEFVALINSDDFWTDREKLARQVATLRENPALAACFGRARFVDKDGRAIQKTGLRFGTVFDQENRSQGKWLRRFFDFGNCLCHPTMLIRRACYDEVGAYNNKLRQLPDLDMWVRLVKRHPIHVAEQEWVNFRVLPGENASSQTASNTVRTINEHFLIALDFFEGVGRELLVDGFGDVLVHSEASSDEHFEIEKALQYFRDNRQGLANPYALIGLLKLSGLLDSPTHRKLLADAYGIDDRWFQAKMAEIDVLRPWGAGVRDILRRMIAPRSK
jgi:glycosyltransferase involved in cell wall biosynthesis